ncbi:MAG: Ku protein [Acidobacteriota bacterium]
MASAIWTGHISFGLISIPVRMFRAARAERVNLRQLHRAGASESPRGGAEVIELPAPRGRPRAMQEPGPEPEPAVPPREMGRRGEPPPPPPPTVERVRRVAASESGERTIPPDELVKGFEYEPDRWVLIDRDEIKRITPQTSKVMQIVEFVRFAEIDPLYFESSYFLVPERAGEKAYAILFEALRQAGFAAVAELTMHGRGHVVILRPGRSGLIAHTMFFENEVRRQEEYRTDTKLAGKREIELAKELVESLAAPFEPAKYHDKFREQLESMIAAKVEGREVAQTQAPQAARAPAVDLVEALQQSLAAARKPPAAAPPSAPKGKRRTSKA